MTKTTADAIRKLGEEMQWQPNWSDHTYTFWVLYLREEDGCFYIQEDFAGPDGPEVRYYNFVTNRTTGNPLCHEFIVQINQVRNEILKQHQERADNA